MKEIAADVAGVIVMSLALVVLIGHDWGALIVWPQPCCIQSKCAGLSVPWLACRPCRWMR
jgi:hypothetical protein